MKTKLDVNNLDRGLPDWLIGLLGNDDHAHWIYRLDLHSPRTYKDKVAMVEFLSTEPLSEFAELSVFLGAHGIEFDRVVVPPRFLDDTFAIVWRPEDHSIVREFIRNLRRVAVALV